MARKIPNIRWGIAVLLFAASILNYIDRQTLSILAPTIQRETWRSAIRITPVWSTSS